MQNYKLKRIFKRWCESGFSEFAGDRVAALRYGKKYGLTPNDVSTIRKIAGLVSTTMQPNKVSKELAFAVRNQRQEGKTLRVIAEENRLSLSTIYNIIHNNLKGV